ncbi:FMRFamide receptor-like [Gigantopelta aegis]|uniref:FMRFamide receptor-like n=1 Tax=Gigantopelta aegis TaxID=1735272 RepID=UPI001B88C975|nr:FMRFamide receptor-like [Gigantopelta aegis]
MENGTIFQNFFNSNFTSKNSLSRELMEWVANHTFSFRVIGAVVAVLGFIGNALAIVVLQRKRMWCSTAYFLVILAVFDNVILLVAMVKCFAALSSRRSVAVRDLQTVMFYPVNYVAQSGTIFMTLIVTLERYVAVTKPLKSRIIFSLTSAKKISLAVLIYCLVYNIPHYVAIDLESRPWNSTTHYPYSEFGASLGYKAVYCVYLQLVFVYMLPWLLMVVFNLLLLHSVRKIKLVRTNCHSKSVSDNGRRLTLPVIAVTTVFFLAYPLPAFEDTICKRTCEADTRIVLELLSEIARVLNSAANFIFYCVLGRRFRRTLFYLTGTWRRRMSSVVSRNSERDRRFGTISKCT